MKTADTVVLTSKHTHTRTQTHTHTHSWRFLVKQQTFFKSVEKRSVIDIKRLGWIGELLQREHWRYQILSTRLVVSEVVVRVLFYELHAAHALVEAPLLRQKCLEVVGVKIPKGLPRQARV